MLVLVESLNPIQIMENFDMPTKREMAGEIVGEFGEYMKDAPQKPYVIRLHGKFFCSHDTAELADQLELAFSKIELNEVYKEIR